MAIFLPHYSTVGLIFLSNMQFDYPYVQCYNSIAHNL